MWFNQHFTKKQNRKRFFYQIGIEANTPAILYYYPHHIVLDNNVHLPYQFKPPSLKVQRKNNIFLTTF
jgi:hypothetical protein